MLDFDLLVADVMELLRHDGRAAYRVLKRRYSLSDDDLEDLKADLIDAKRVAADEDGKVLVWVGAEAVDAVAPAGATAAARAAATSPSPASYTPAHLAARIRSEQAELAARAPREGERKTITVLFADLKGSTALLDGLDPEEGRTILDPALQLMMDAVHRYDGYVAQALGDGILALFGAPLAQEDHAQRAVFAALYMQEEMTRHGNVTQLRHGVPLSLRVGINTGEVVVRSIRKDDLHTDYVPVGHSINLAARMEQMATPGSVLVTEYTQRLVDGYVRLKALGAAAIKGVETPLSVYEVLGVGQYRTRLQLAARRGLTRFVGRQQELGQLQRALDEAVAGRSQVVGVMGEPGMGKSRLFHEFKALTGGACTVLEAYSSSHGKAWPYLPVTELLKSYFQILAQDDERTRREKVIGRVLGLDRGLEDTLPLFFSLLNVADVTGSLQQMEPQVRRRRTFESLKRVVLRESMNRPLVVIFEDLHWIDSETQGLLDHLVEALGNARVLLLTNYRPEYRHEWGGKTYYTQLRLTPFGRAEADEFLTALLGADPAEDTAGRWQTLRTTILERTEGTPFFMEEVVQELFEQGVLVRDEGGRVALGTLSGEVLQLPATVQGVLAARIDRLAAEEKALLQQLAVIGREFSLGLVQAVVERRDEALLGVLATLLRKEFLYEQPAFREVEYIFKHALTQEVAYQSLLVENRKLIHARTAQALEQLHALALEDHYGALAHHYGRSDNLAKAIDYAELAGLQATRQAANDDAVRLLREACAMLARTAPGPARDGRELRLLLSLAAPLQMISGVTSDDVAEVFARGRTLVHTVGTADEQLRLNAGMRTILSMRCEAEAAAALSDEMLQMAEREQDPHFATQLALQAHAALAVSLTCTGHHVEAIAHAARTLEVYNFERDRQLTHTFSWDPCGLAGGYLAMLEFFRGQLAAGRSQIEATLAHARRLGHPQNLGFALAWRGMMHLILDEASPALAAAEITLEHALEHSLPDWVGYAYIVRGWARAACGDTRGIEETRQAIDAMRAANAVLGSDIFLSRLAEVCLAQGRLVEARRCAADAATHSKRTGDKMWDGEVLRVRGEVALHDDGVENRVGRAESLFEQALAIARERGALLWELRAALSLGRLRAARGQRSDAHALVAKIYARFDPGDVAPDLGRARSALLEWQ